MRFFKAEIVAEDCKVRAYENAGHWREVEKKAILYPYEDYSDRTSADGDRKFFVSIACAEAHIDENQIIGYLEESFDEWGVVGVQSIKVSECAYAETEFRSVGMGGQLFLRLGRLFHAEDLLTLLSRTRFFWDYTIDDAIPKNEIQNAARKTSYAQALSGETARIEAQRRPRNAEHTVLPVHYIIEGSNPHEYQAAIDILLEALYETGRIPSSHVYCFEADKVSSSHAYNRTIENDEIIKTISDALGDSLEASSIVITYGQTDQNTTYDELNYAAFTKFLDILEPHRNDIQVIFVVPEGSEDVKMRIRRRFPAPFIEIKPDPPIRATQLEEEQAIALLRERALKEGLAPDEELERIVHICMQDKSFTDLDAAYEQWEQLTLTRDLYPQYLSIVEAAIDSNRSAKRKGAAERLDELIGLTQVKEQIKEVLKRFAMNRELACAGMNPLPFSMHLAFLGAPGTGKTEVARLYAEILKDEGILSEGRLITRSGGQSWNIEKAFKEAKGSVLFVDEAYAMENITEFIAHMENCRHDTVVILAGYKDHIEALISRNPGFRSRISYFIEFPEYSADEKLEIFKLMAKRAQIKLPKKTISALRDVLARGGRRNDEGNARFVRNLFERAIGAQQVRLANLEPEGGYTKRALATLLEEDVITAARLPNTSKITGREQLENLIGLTQVKKFVSDRISYLRVQKAKRDSGIEAPYLPMHMAFKGNPGTGKTEVARVLGQILREEGILSVGDFFEYQGTDLLFPAPIFDIFQEAKGSVIFIDEAYTLSASRTAIAEIIACMENLRDDIVVIFAGYSAEIDQLLDANPGFASRVKIKLDFPDYSSDELIEILKVMAKGMHMKLGRGCTKRVREIVAEASMSRTFGNARFVRTLLEDAMVAQSVRLVDADPSLRKIDKAAFVTLKPDDFAWTPPEAEPQVGFF